MLVLPECNAAVPHQLISFNRINGNCDCTSTVHFYTDDYQFERFWRLPERYVYILKKYQSIIAPDFSLYVDAPKIVNLWNVYRNRLVTLYLVINGVIVIPSASWADASSLEYCFDGLPTESVISVGSIGANRNGKTRCLWQYGVDCLIERLAPTKLLVYGNSITVANSKADVVYYEDMITKLRKQCSRKKK